MLSSRWAFFSLPCSWLYEPVFHLDIFLINVSLSYDKHLLTKKWEDKWNHFWFLTYIIHNYEKKNSRKYNQYPLSVLCKITICSIIPFYQNIPIYYIIHLQLQMKIQSLPFWKWCSSNKHQPINSTMFKTKTMIGGDCYE